MSRGIDEMSRCMADMGHGIRYPDVPHALSGREMGIRLSDPRGRRTRAARDVPTHSGRRTASARDRSIR
jgi:hypothetical protein